MIRSFAATALLWSTSVLAHMMPAQQGTLNVVEDSVFAVVALPVLAFTGVDDDGDGRLSDQEVALHEAALTTQVGTRYRLFDADQPGTLELVLVRAEHDERSETSVAGAPTLLVMLKARFTSSPESLRIETDLFGSEGGAAQLTVKAIRGAEVETAVLTPARSGHRYFRGPLRMLVDAVRLEHLVLIALVVAVAGWRRSVA